MYVYRRYEFEDIGPMVVLVVMMKDQIHDYIHREIS